MTTQPIRPDQPSFAELFTPKLVTVLREGYGVASLRADLVAALTVAIVALPLSMAIAIASGVTPDRGLYASIFGGFVVSLLSGSRFQIGGPAGAFIVLVAASVARHGIEGVLLAVMISGFVLMAAGFLRLGTYIKYIPYPVTVGFTAAIAVIIAASEVKDLFGLTVVNEPGPLLPKLAALWAAAPSVSPSAVAVAAFAIATMLVIRQFRPHWPAYLIAVGAASLGAFALHLPVETIGSRFGGIPQYLPAPHLAFWSIAKLTEVFPDALAFTLLGGIESLLSAVVADSMTGRRHRSNCELVAQGAANIVAALFGGICVTGTVARTATNVRAGARSPLSGIFHAIFLALFVLIAAPLARYIPLAALAAVLAVVAWSVAEKHAFWILLRSSRGDAVVLLATFLLTILVDLPTGIVAGFGIGTLLFMHRMAQAVAVETATPTLIEEDRPDSEEGGRPAYDPALATDPDILVYRISGAFFFGAAAMVAAALDRIAAKPKAYVVDFSAVPIADSTAAATIVGFARTAARHRATVFIAGANPTVRKILAAHGLMPPLGAFSPSIAEAVIAARRGIATIEKSGAALAAAR